MGPSPWSRAHGVRAHGPGQPAAGGNKYLRLGYRLAVRKYLRPAVSGQDWQQTVIINVSDKVQKRNLLLASVAWMLGIQHQQTH